MDLHKLGVKFFMTDPKSVSLPEFIPVFQRWIQGQVIAGHLLVDVHNYSHIHHGPGILLVAHEGNFSIDMAGGRMGLLYYRKQLGAPGQHISQILKTGLQACNLLEKETILGGGIKFRKDELQLIANDRLLAPNDDKTFSELQPVLSAALQDVLGSKDFKLSRTSQDPKERFTVGVQIS